MLNVSDRSIQHAAVVRDSECADLITAVEQGKIAVSAAASVAKLDSPVRDSIVHKVNAGLKPTEAIRQAKREALPAKIVALPEGKYRVIYADPPWKYNDTKQSDRWHTISALDHYADQDLEMLKRLDVRSIAADDCVLFCWGTFPLLKDAFELIESWGFTYKTAFVWDKGHGYFGNYHNVEAELLVVATRGSCTPEIDTKEHQIQRIPKTKHSKKPEEFRALIDRIYPPHPPKVDRVELFRRGERPAPHWDIWGGEAADEKAA